MSGRKMKCVNNKGCEVSLTVGKVYEVNAGRCCAGSFLIRIVDDTEEDYLFHIDRFEPIGE